MAKSKKTPLTEKSRLSLKDLLQKAGLYTVACRECTKKADVEDLFTAFFEAMTGEIAQGNEVQIYGFGKFSPKVYAGRKQRSGLPGVKGGVAEFGDVNLMKFKLSPMAKDVLNGRTRPESQRGRKPSKPAAEEVVLTEGAVTELPPSKKAKKKRKAAKRKAASKPRAKRPIVETAPAATPAATPAPTTSPTSEAASAT